MAYRLLYNNDILSDKDEFNVPTENTTWTKIKSNSVLIGVEARKYISDGVSFRRIQEDKE
jgi:hypothetical protein